MVAGLVAYVVIIFWALVWIVAQIVSKVSGAQISNRNVLYIASTITFLVSTLTFLFRSRLKTPLSLWDPVDEAENGDPIPWFILPFLPFVLVGVLYIIKALFYIWDPSLSPILAHRFVIVFGLICALIYAVFMVLVACSEWMASMDRRTRLRGYLTIGSLATAVLLGSVGTYSYTIYPRIPREFGGGRPERIIIWVGTEDFPSPLPLVPERK
jgi:hypothetical protein